MNWRKVIVLLCLCGLAVGPAAGQSSRKRLQERIDELIKKAVEEQARKPATNAPSPLQPLYDELERQYLGGDLTARQFMRMMQELQLMAGTNSDPRALSVLPAYMRAAGSLTNGPAYTGTNAVPAEDVTLGDIERKLDELLKRKEQMDKAAATNAVPMVEPKTKREKLDYILRLLIAEKITREEYEKRRAKIVAEPD